MKWLIFLMLIYDCIIYLRISILFITQHEAPGVNEFETDGPLSYTVIHKTNRKWINRLYQRK